MAFCFFSHYPFPFVKDNLPGNDPKILNKKNMARKTLIWHDTVEKITGNKIYLTYSMLILGTKSVAL